MKSFRKILRLLRLILFIVLTCIGVGLEGGVPVPLTSKKRDAVEVQIELPEPEKEDKESAEFKIKE